MSSSARPCRYRHGTRRSSRVLDPGRRRRGPTWTAEYPSTRRWARRSAPWSATARRLLGRTTYETFAPAWSARTVEDAPGAPFFNDTRKYVASSTLTDPRWGPATVLQYSPDAVRQLTDEVDGAIYVSGSATLVRALLADGLVDKLHLFVHPVAFGSGTRLFPSDGPATKLRLVGCEAYDSGVVHLTYDAPATSPNSSVPTDG